MLLWESILKEEFFQLLNLFVSFLLCAAASLLPPPGYCVCGLRRRSTMSENYTLDIQQSIGGTMSEAAAG